VDRNIAGGPGVFLRCMPRCRRVPQGDSGENGDETGKPRLGIPGKLASPTVMFVTTFPILHNAKKKGQTQSVEPSLLKL